MLDSPESAVDDPQVSDTASSGSVASLGLGTPVIYTGKNDELVRITASCLNPRVCGHL